MTNSSNISIRDLLNKYDLKDNTSRLLSLWHYTSSDGLMGIIRNDPNEHKKLHFWFTRSDCLNDPSEGKHILDMFQQTCSELLEKKVITQSFYEIIKSWEIPDDEFINFPIPSCNDYVHESVLRCVPCDAYICSFSLKEDSLEMWRYYSKGNGGYGLKCWSLLFEKYKKYEYSDYDKDATYISIRSYKVIYKDEEKKQILNSIITDTFSAYINSCESEDEKTLNAKHFIQYMLKTLQFQFKHECYSSEQEYRFVAFVPRKKPEELSNKLPEVKYRAQTGVLIPYIDIGVEKGNSYLEELLVSPFIKNERVLDTTKNYLFQCGYNINVNKSQLPVRELGPQF